jgi:RNA polymerase sigma-70 factor (ECF subfamily)
LVQLDQRRSIGSFPKTLADAKNGDEAAWATFYHGLAGPVTGYLAGHGVNEADDLAGEVFLQIARDIHRFEGDESSFRSWVFVIAHRRMIDWRRAAMRRPQMTEGDDRDLPAGNVEDEAMENLALDGLGEILGSLTEEQRQVLVLRVISDLSLKETADAMGKSVGAIKALQRRALLAVRSELEERGVSL